MNPLLVTMNAPIGGARPLSAEDYLALDDFQAGIVALGIFGRQFPGMKMSDLPNLAKLSTAPAGMAGGFISDLGSFVGRQYSNIGGVVADTVRLVGGAAGDAVRLVTDDSVVDGASKLAAAGLSAYSGVPGGDQIASFLQALGANFKGDVATATGQAKPMNWIPWAAGAAGAVLLVVLLRPAARVAQ